jgi:myosin heavy subunit
MEGEMNQWEDEREHLLLDAEAVRGEYEGSLARVTEENRDFRAKLEQLTRDNGRLNEEKGDSDHLIKELTSRNLELLAKIATVEQTIKPLNEDLLSQVGELRDKLERVESRNRELTTQEDDLKYMESRYGKTQSQLTEVVGQLEAKNREIERLTQIIAASDDLIYHAVKDDPVDRKLAEYIKACPLRVRFRIMRLERESEGVYKYGMKRVFIKIENEQLIIRVGGGFMNMDEFVEQYCSAQGGGLSDTAAVLNQTMIIQDQTALGGSGSKRSGRYQYAQVVQSRAGSKNGGKRKSSGNTRSQQQHRIGGYASHSQYGGVYSKMGGFRPIDEDDSLQVSSEVCDIVNIAPFKYD